MSLQPFPSNVLHCSHGFHVFDVETLEDASIGIRWNFQHQVHVHEDYTNLPALCMALVITATFIEERNSLQYSQERSPGPLFPFPHEPWLGFPCPMSSSNPTTSPTFLTIGESNVHLQFHSHQSPNQLTHPYESEFTSFEVDGGQKPSRMGKGILEFYVSGEGGRGSYVIFHAMKCAGIGWWERCWDVAYVTKDLFTTSSLLMEDVSGCRFAHSSKEFKHSAEQDLIYCVSQDEKSANHDMSPRNSRLFYSTDFFKTDRKPVRFDLPNIRDARGIVAFAIVSKSVLTKKSLV
ncbi:hypothetical protein DL96DRAFT_557792 [Flagelloscypha sp. PMI_526]|nr:hypothetical protein DL96DRAFT_557792 [Flagelloscypha sp. PMI_526]